MTPLQLAHDGIEAEIEDLLAAGRPVVLVIEVTAEFENANAYGTIEIPDIRSPAGDYHAVLVVGAATRPVRGRCLLARNSWGEFWGAGGYGWLPMDYLIAYAIQAATVTT
jgi:C1A family cysteine protease